MNRPDTLDGLLEEHALWLAVERGVAANTRIAYARDLRDYATFLSARLAGRAAVDGVAAPVRCDELDETDVAAYVEHLRAPDADGRRRAPATVARAVAAVRSFHRFCADEELTGSDPAAEVAAPRVPAGIPKALTEEEVLALLRSAEAAVETAGSGPGSGSGALALARRDRALLEVLYGTGARISEVVAADVADLDAEHGELRVLGKGGKERVVPVGAVAAAAVAAWLPDRLTITAAARARRARPRKGGNARREGEPLFVNGRGGRLTRQGAFGIVRRHGGAAGLGGRLSPHVLRHSCATHMVDRGADLRVVQELLGHRRVSTTQVYTKVSATRLRAVFEAAHPRARRARGDVD